MNETSQALLEPPPYDQALGAPVETYVAAAARKHVDDAVGDALNTETAEQKERRWARVHPEGMMTRSGEDQIVLWNFGVADSRLKPEQKEALDGFVCEHLDDLKGDATLKVYGAASATASDKFNHELSAKRAGSVVAAIASLAPGSVKLQTAAQESDFQGGSSGEDLARERRVVVTLVRPTLPEGPLVAHMPVQSVEPQPKAAAGTANPTPTPPDTSPAPIDLRDFVPSARQTINIRGIVIPIPVGALVIDLQVTVVQIGGPAGRITLDLGDRRLQADIVRIVQGYFARPLRFTFGTERLSVGLVFGDDDVSVDLELNYRDPFRPFTVSGRVRPSLELPPPWGRWLQVSSVQVRGSMMLRSDYAKKLGDVVEGAAKKIAPYAMKLAKSAADAGRAVGAAAVEAAPVLAELTPPGAATLSFALIPFGLYDMFVRQPEKGLEISMYADARRGYIRFLEHTLFPRQAPELSSPAMEFGWEAAKEGWEQIGPAQQTLIDAAQPYKNDATTFRQAILNFLGPPTGTQPLRDPAELLKGLETYLPKR